MILLLTFNIVIISNKLGGLFMGFIPLNRLLYLVVPLVFCSFSKIISADQIIQIERMLEQDSYKIWQQHAKIWTQDVEGYFWSSNSAYGWEVGDIVQIDYSYSNTNYPSSDIPTRDVTIKNLTKDQRIGWATRDCIYRYDLNGLPLDYDFASSNDLILFPRAIFEDEIIEIATIWTADEHADYYSDLVIWTRDTKEMNPKGYRIYANDGELSEWKIGDKLDLEPHEMAKSCFKMTNRRNNEQVFARP